MNHNNSNHIDIVQSANVIYLPFFSSSSSPWSAAWCKWCAVGWCPVIDGTREWLLSAGCGWCGWWWLRNLTAAAAAWCWACILCWTWLCTCPRTGWCGGHPVKWNGNTGVVLWNNLVGASKDPPEALEPLPGGSGKDRPPPGSNTMFGTNSPALVSPLESDQSSCINLWDQRNSITREERGHLINGTLESCGLSRVGSAGRCLWRR